MRCDPSQPAPPHTRTVPRGGGDWGWSWLLSGAFVVRSTVILAWVWQRRFVVGGFSVRR